jgi:aminopeptidase
MNSGIFASKYAELIARTGANVQKGQYVLIRANVGIEDFAAKVAEECYKAGASRVVFEWQSRRNRSAYPIVMRTTEDLGAELAQEIGAQEFATDKLPILIWIDGDDPDGLKGLDASKSPRSKPFAMPKTPNTSKPARTNISGASPAPLRRNGPRKSSRISPRKPRSRSFGPRF